MRSLKIMPAVVKASSARQRRGITLLFVISLIVLFLLMGTSFVLLANQYRKSARASSRIDTRIDDSRSLVSRAFYDLLREPAHSSINSPLRGHSILGDQYGYGLKAVVYNAAMPKNTVANQDPQGQMIVFSLDDNGDPNTFPAALTPPATPGDVAIRILDGFPEILSNTGSEYEGQVLTFVSGPLAGTSVRILAYQVNAIPGAVAPNQLFTRQFVILPGMSSTSITFSDTVSSVPITNPPPSNMSQLHISSLNGSEVVINRRDFAGTGAGMFFSDDVDPNVPVLPPATRITLDRPRFAKPNSIFAQGVGYQGLINNIYGLDEVPGSTRMNLREIPTTLLPNRVGESATELVSRYLSRVALDRPAGAVPPYRPNVFANSESTNEDYDAADTQNMFLAHVRPGSSMRQYGAQVIPSFYRPELVRYFNLVDRASAFLAPPPTPTPATCNSNPALVLSFRSLLYDKDGRPRREQFLADILNADGSSRYVDQVDNVTFYEGMDGVIPDWVSVPANGYGDGIPDRGWDVDNDSDGVMDSIWMNPGFPVMTDAKGRRLKPLVAYMVQDMDSRINVNTDGNLTMQEIQANRFKTPQTFLGGTTATGVGQGYGPGEIRYSTTGMTQFNAPNNVLGLDSYSVLADPAIELTQLMRGAVVAGYSVPGRYGADLVPGMPGRDAASAYKLFTYPDRSFAALGLLGNGFSSFMDIHGRVSVGVPDNVVSHSADPYDTTATNLDLPYGMPVIDMVGSALTSENVNSGFEQDFSRSPFSASLGSNDTPFSPRELESLLRRYDWDSATLPSRLRLLLSSSFSNSNFAINQTLTTDSQEVPVPADNLVQRLRRAMGELNAGIFGSWPEPKYASLPPNPQPWTQLQNNVANLNIQWMLAPEVIQGRKMDLNSPLGNGFDDNANGIVDEAEESISMTGELRPDPFSGARTKAGIGMDYDRDGVVPNDADHARIRQDYARHLYVLILLTTQYIDRDGDGQVNLSDWYDYNNDAATNVADLYDYRRDVAQWVANVVEFRDPDSICTGYEFDLNPWDGWQVDGDLTTIDTTAPGTMSTLLGVPQIPAADRLVVWGSERPELLLTEVMAMHDRRTGDLDTDPSGMDVAGGDDDLDSLIVPNASCFIELYNPWYRGSNALAVGNTEVFPGEFYNSVTGGVDLDKVAGSGANASPVWRIEATRQDGLTPNEQSIRTIYFVRPANVALQTPGTYFPTGVRPGDLLPGQHAVIGSTGVNSGGRYFTYIGRRNTPSWDTELGDTRHIILDPAANAVTLRWWDDVNSRWETTNRRGLVVVPIGSHEDGTASGEPRSIGLTDPLNGYVSFAPAGTTLSPVADGFEFRDAASLPLTLDQPIDKTANDEGMGMFGEWDQFDRVQQLDGFPQVDSDEMGDSWSPTPGGLKHDMLHVGVRRIKLQRLANPLTGYDPVTNPYLTVDVLGADVASFNGSSNAIETDAGPNPADLVLASFERSTNRNQSPVRGVAAPAPPPQVDFDPNQFNDLNLWRSDIFGRNRNPVIAQAVAGRVYSISLPAPLATGPFLYPAFANTDSHFVSQNIVNSLGEPDLGYRQEAGTPGYSLKAFPWLTWNNRPFVSGLELANVPATPRSKADATAPNAVIATAQMLNAFSLHNPSSTFYARNAGNSDDRYVRGTLSGRFSHLPDFLLDVFTDSGNADPGTPGFQRFLDYVEVPSRYVGTDFDLNPDIFGASYDGTAANAGSASEIGYKIDPGPGALNFRYTAPFNTVSRFRNPGKINLNTVSSLAVWTGVMGPHATPSSWTASGYANGFFALANSRQDPEFDAQFLPDGSPAPPMGLPGQGLRLPSEFAFPFRSPDRGSYVPELNVPQFAPNAIRLTPESLVMRSAQTTLFRAVDPMDPDAAGSVPLMDVTTVAVQGDPDRNAYFRHEMRQRLQNMTTTRSSVFGIWITIGFFELDDNGNISSTEGAPRQRGFYLIDRSIPVAFEPGKNHNVDRVILSSSIIE